MSEEFETINANELAQKVGKEALLNKIRIMAIKNLLVESGAFTQEQFESEFDKLIAEKTEEYVHELLYSDDEDEEDEE